MHGCSKSSGPKFTAKAKPILLIGCLAGTLVLAGTAFCAGAAGIGAEDLLAWLVGKPTPSGVGEILLHVRLPRIAAAWLCGMALALAGLLLQSALGNALASPGTIGVNSGAGFCVVAAAAFLPAAVPLRTAAAFCGALSAALLVYALARKTGGSRMTIVMAGVAVSSLLSAGIDAIVTFRPDSLLDRAAFSIGGFGGVFGGAVRPVLPFLALGVVGALLLSSRLNLLLLGDEVASSLGLRVGLTRFLAILCASLLAAAAVSVGGLLGFVGLIVPHAMRFLVGNDYRWLTPFTAMGGGMFLLLCDTLARVLFAPFELPVGILLSFLGAPFFLWLLLHRRRRLEL